MQDLFDGLPNLLMHDLAFKRVTSQTYNVTPSRLTDLNRLHDERESLLRRTVEGKPGVNDLRARLRLVTHAIMREELGL